MDGEIQVHGGHDHDHKLNGTQDLAPVWPEGWFSENSPHDQEHGQHSHNEQDHGQKLE